MCGDSVLPERFPLPSTGLMTRGVLLAAFVLPAAAQKVCAFVVLLAAVEERAASHPQGVLRLPLQVDWVQTARFKDGSTNLLQDMPAVHFEPMPEPPTELTLELDTSKTYQEILGFGGAFTEASAINWRKLSEAEQAEVIRLYFASPEDGGHGYTLGRVPSEHRRSNLAGFLYLIKRTAFASRPNSVLQHVAPAMIRSCLVQQSPPHTPMCSQLV